MLNRRRVQQVSKTPCLCEHIINGAKVEGDKLCGGPEMVLEIRESKAQTSGGSSNGEKLSDGLEKVLEVRGSKPRSNGGSGGVKVAT